MSNVFRSDKKSSGGANLQNKSVTATVAAQTVLPDSGYDGLSEVTVNPQDHTGTHELVTTNHPANNPLDLGANHNVRYIPIQVGEGTFQETTLWENSSPTASFSAQAVTLSDDITNYDYIRVYWRYSTSDATESSELMSVSDFQQSETTGKPNMALGVRTSSPTKRGVSFASNTSVGIASAVSDAGNVANGNAIPTKITGLSPIVVSGTKTITENGTGIDVANYEFVDVNVSGGGSLDETTLWTNPNPTSDFSGQTVTLSDDIDNYDYIKIEFDGSNIAAWDTTPNVSVIFSVSEFKTTANADKHIRCAAGAQGSTNYTRLFNYVTNTTLQFGNSVNITNGSLVNSANIPIKISGLKLGGEIVRAIDVSNKVSLVNNSNTITLAKDSILVVSVPDNSNGNITVDGESIFSDSTAASTFHTNVNMQLSLKAGQVIVSSLTAQNAKLTCAWYAPYFD